MSVILGFSSGRILMLDCDNIASEKLIEWCKKRTQKYHLGSVLIMRSSECKQLAIDQRKLPDSYNVIFGRKIDVPEINVHIKRALKDGIVNKRFEAMREHTGGLITLRVNSKNDSKPHPVPFYYFRNGERKAVMEYLRFWSLFKNLDAYSISKRRRRYLNGKKQRKEAKKETKKEHRGILH